MDQMTNKFDFIEFLNHKISWSAKNFGPGRRTKGIVAHIRKELQEVEANPTDLEEWADIILLAIDGAWRSGATSEQIAGMLMGKMRKNELRNWPDWRKMKEGDPIEHVREGDVSRSDLFDGGHQEK